MTLPTVPPTNTTLVYEIALALGVLGTLILNAATFIKTLTEKKEKEKELAAKEKENDANAAAVNIKTTLELLPPLKERIKELEALVSSLEAEVKELEDEVERLTNEKNTLRAKLSRIEKANTLQRKKMEEAARDDAASLGEDPPAVP